MYCRHRDPSQGHSAGIVESPEWTRARCVRRDAGAIDEDDARDSNPRPELRERCARRLAASVWRRSKSEPDKHDSRASPATRRQRRSRTSPRSSRIHRRRARADERLDGSVRVRASARGRRVEPRTPRRTARLPDWLHRARRQGREKRAGSRRFAVYDPEIETRSMCRCTSWSTTPLRRSTVRFGVNIGATRNRPITTPRPRCVVPPTGTREIAARTDAVAETSRGGGGETRRARNQSQIPAVHRRARG